MRCDRKSTRGFTLVELSIVLVIIGLIVASVLVGQDLIRQGELRATVTQFEQYLAATGTFKTKYAGIPGDTSGAAYFTNPGPAVGNGDGNGVLSAPEDSLALDNENVVYWSQLGSNGAALITGSFDGALVTTTNVADNLPATKSGGFWGAFGVNGINYLYIGVTSPDANGEFDTADVLTPLDALSIDTKVDDGIGSSGIALAHKTADNDPVGSVVATSGVPNPATAITALDANADKCTYTSNGLELYNTLRDADACTIAIRLSIK